MLNRDIHLIYSLIIYASVNLNSELLKLKDEPKSISAKT